MKILVIIHEYPPAGAGAAVACENMVKYLAGAGNNVLVLTAASHSLPREEVFNNCIIKRAVGIRREAFKTRFWEVAAFISQGNKFLKKEIGNIKPDLVFAFFTLPAGAIALSLKRRYKIPYFVFLRGIDVPGSYGGKLSFFNKLLAPFIKRIWANADLIIANSQSLRSLAGGSLKDKIIYVIPNGIDTAIFYPPKTRKTGGKLNILSVGRLSREKGLDYLLDSALLLTEKGLDFTLDIIGDGPEKERLVNKCLAYRISDMVNFKGWVSRDDIAEVYRGADIFVTFSLFESMPNALFEAMACGLPVVVSDIPAHRESIMHNINGLIVPVKDPLKLARAITLLAADEGLRLKMNRENVLKASAHNCHDAFASLQNLIDDWKKTTSG